MRILFYLTALLGLTLLTATMPWGSAYLSLIIILTYLMFRPQRVLHPNNMIFAFYGLYVVLSSTLNLILYLIDWEYVLPWGQWVFWDTFSLYLLLQAEFTFLVLFFSFYFFAPDVASNKTWKTQNVEINSLLLKGLYVFTFVLVIWFIQSTGGLLAWVNEYSLTYLTKREGHGLLNVMTITFGNIVVFLLGLKAYYAKQKFGILAWALIIIVPLSYINGVKSRFIFLLIMLLAPLLMKMQFRLKHLALFVALFFVLLYLGTWIRTEGFYASGPFFLEMLVGYFNSFQLHDYVVTSREPALLQTIGQIFIKPMQILGLADGDANFDISVMLTKEFFPEQWENEHATQQWPLDTELYLNYYGPWLSWIPLIAYGLLLSKLYRSAVLGKNYALMPIYIIEFQRIFSTMRGTIIPWEVFIYVAQYLLIYVICKQAIQTIPTLTEEREVREIPEPLQTPAEVCSESELWRCVLQALENERCLDIRYRCLNPVSGGDAVIPNYKVMKQKILFDRLGIMYRPVLVIARLLIPVVGIAQFGFAAVIALIRRPRPDSTKFHMLATTPGNIHLIKAALSSKGDCSAYDIDLLGLTRLVVEIRLTGVSRCALAYMRLLAHIIVAQGTRRGDLLLHMRDAAPLLMLAYFARTNPDQHFVTDDHYQRWCYILSNNSQNLQLVQHGFVDTEIEFEHAFGEVQLLFVRDQSFVRYFAQYYKIREWCCFSSLAALDDNPVAAGAVFLASSFPSIDIEIEFMRALRARSDVHIIVKFHPSHYYDGRKRELASLADYVSPAEQNPACRIFVSHSSFMEYDYSALGIQTVSILRSGGVSGAVEAVLRQMDK